jgi:hypothetical protein
MALYILDLDAGTKGVKTTNQTMDKNVLHLIYVHVKQSVSS